MMRLRFWVRLNSAFVQQGEQHTGEHEQSILKSSVGAGIGQLEQSHCLGEDDVWHLGQHPARLGLFQEFQQPRELACAKRIEVEGQDYS